MCIKEVLIHLGVLLSGSYFVCLYVFIVFTWGYPLNFISHQFLRKYNDLFELNTAGSLVHLVDPMKGKASSPDHSPSKSPRDGARQDNTNAASEENHVKEEGGEEGQDQSNKERAIARYNPEECVCV